MQEFDNNFFNAEDFVDCISRGGEVEFIYDNKKYGVSHYNDKIAVYEAYNESSEILYDNPYFALEYKIGDRSLGDIMQDMKVTFRTF